MDAGRRVLGPRVDLLERLRLFEGASRPALEQMAAAVVEERVPAGTVVLRQGDPADDLLVLVDSRRHPHPARPHPGPAVSGVGNQTPPVSRT